MNSSLLFALAVFLFLVAGTESARVQSRRTEQQIIGGTTADDGEFPFFALMFIDEEEYSCGGALIKDDAVLTAAHCFCLDKDPFTCNKNEYPFVRIGGTAYDEGERINVTDVTFHPDWVASGSDGGSNIDLAIMKLASPSSATTVTLNADVIFPWWSDNTNVKLIGYGETSDGGEPSTVLKEVEMKALTKSTCQQLNPEVTDNHVCADGGDEGSCSGDSGGPLLYNNNVIVGVNSYSGGSCASDGSHDIFIDVAQHYNWIVTTAGIQTLIPNCCAARVAGYLFGAAAEATVQKFYERTVSFFG